MSAPIEYYLGCISRLEAQRDTLEQERDQLRAEVERLSAVVTVMEFSQARLRAGMNGIDICNEIIAARRKP